MTTKKRPMVRIHDLSTDEMIDREMTDAEFADHETMLTEELAKKNAIEAKSAEKAALLTKLGITNDEAKLLLS